MFSYIQLMRHGPCLQGGRGRAVPITRCHTTVPMIKSQQSSSACISQRGNRVEKQKVIWSCVSEVIWMKLLNSYQERFLFLIHHLEHLVLKTSQTGNQVNGEMAFGRDTMARGPGRKETRTWGSIYITSMHFTHTLQHSTHSQCCFSRVLASWFFYSINHLLVKN